MTTAKPWFRSILLLIAVLVGISSATQSRINGQVAIETGGSTFASAISFGTGFLLLVVVWLVRGESRAGLRRILDAVAEGRLPWWGLGGGVLGAIYVFVQSTAVPVTGVAIFMVALLVGQLFGGLLLDATGAFGAPKRVITLQRLVGALVSLAAVVVVGWGSGIGAEAILPLLLSVVAGLALAVQLGITGQVKMHAEEVTGPTIVNFAVGSIILVAAALIHGLVAPGDFRGFPTDWWLYLAGAIGVTYVLIVAFAVRGLGILLLTLALVGGQLLGSVIWDAVGGQVSVGLALGVPIAFLGIVIVHTDGMWRRPPRV
ncbi:hypothetical protein EG850_06345 [Gulosibacter macacae]|uniref:DMT family transporter n=1 Tax=Gulosibacter macacae TaxID=2488791 RepID=A0A3P3VXE0_9MICO|nr:DMT family transporter [Gulosibacter macacae]RRJ87017.1 hypothetical protein EG850_06345 [Gulosibacter macacae]